ncbi:pilus assembly FimT family protein [Ectothiorhodospira variabilis]|uniref:pilus assembly FimT family protein n=1 Tax=Ectothiorhodospira variabilis TaxID=505694 RepID=UPI001EFADDBB|nr:hypothetical protein [Ectothiorhodospira variabilis]MCG5495754.1 hypothetical protein [Ectothiorhodospira variabilis]MCG5498539.1 hypothetical protein [Ectothiorhodospira variabilis]MCG5505219.1 hypothetical protein [Ectothiorhodospira variabilis]MCG5508344.1 hypothetical protein [Ectothiorhodospira variabilis]
MSFQSYRGVTLVELIIVLAFVTLLAVTTLPRVDFRVFSDTTFEHELGAAIQYARREAMNTGCQVKVVIKPANDEFKVEYKDTTCSNSQNGLLNGLLPHPFSDEPYKARSKSGNVIKSVSADEIIFSRMGMLEGESDIEIEFSNGHRITLTAGTGYVKR